MISKSRLCPVVIVVAVFGASSLLAACGGTTAGTASPTATVAAPTSKPGSTAVVTAPPGAITAIPVAEGPIVLAATADAIWVEDHRANMLSRIDPAQDKEVARLADVSIHCDVTAGGGAVWATDAHASIATKVDPSTGAVLGTIELRDACGVAADEDELWLASPGLGRAFRYDPQTLEEKASVELGPMVFFVRIGPEAVWAAGEAYGGTVYRIDPATNEKVAEIPAVNPFATGLEVGFGAVWVPARDHASLYRIDPSTNALTTTIKVPSYVGGIGVGSTAIWVSGWGDGMVYRIDPATNRIIGSIGTGYGNLGPLVEAFGSLWVGALDRNVVLRIDPEAIVD